MADDPAVAKKDETAHVFRTYASDVAKFTGKLLSEEVKNEPAPKKPMPVPVPPRAIPPPLPKTPPVNEPLPRASIAEPAKPVPAPIAPPPAGDPDALPLSRDPDALPTPPPPVPHAPPQPPPPAKIIPKAPTTNESREEVLARLKRKATEGESRSAVPLPQAPVSSVIPKAPSTNETREAILARLKARGKAAAHLRGPGDLGSLERGGVPEIKPETSSPSHAEKPTSGPSPIHTYKTDFADEKGKRGASRISMLAAEQDARGTRAPETLAPKSKNYTMVILAGVVLISAGVGSIYATYRFATGRPAIPEELYIPSLIFADERMELSGEGKVLQGALAGIEGGNLKEGGVIVAYTTYATTTAEGAVVHPESGGALILALALPAPELLLRNIEQESTVGVVRAGSETRPFFILRVSSFERTFAGMLDWEDTIENDLKLLYPPYPHEPSSAGTSTPFSLPPIRSGFTDEIIANRDVRVLRDVENRIVMLYGYRDKKTLIIARDEAAFSELLDRLAASRTQ